MFQIVFVILNSGKGSRKNAAPKCSLRCASHCILLFKPTSEKSQLLLKLHLQNVIGREEFSGKRWKKRNPFYVRGFLTISRTPFVALQSGAAIFALILGSSHIIQESCVCVCRICVQSCLFTCVSIGFAWDVCFSHMPTCPQHAINNIFLRCLFLQFLAVHFLP